MYKLSMSNFGTQCITAIDEVFKIVFPITSLLITAIDPKKSLTEILQSFVAMPSRVVKRAGKT